MVSVIIPFYNEEGNLRALYTELTQELKRLGTEYEIILVNDGSTDNSAQVADDVSKDKKGKVLHLHRRFGKGEALTRGLAQAKGATIIFMDGDLQDDPAYIGEFLKKLDAGYDLVNGARKIRRDNALIRLYSKSLNRFLRSVFNSPFTDINCGFKAFRKSILNDVPLYGNNFRFFPLAAQMNNYRVAEVQVENRPRHAGKSKFGISKIFIGFFDTMSAYFLFKFAKQPLHFFGSIGSVFFATGFAWALYLSYERLFHGVLLYRRPALQFAVLLIIVGIQIIMTGFIGELIVYLHKKDRS